MGALKKAPPSHLDRYVESRLKEWGRWYMKVLTNSLGYPSHSITYRLKSDGAIGGKSTAPKPIPLNSDAEEIDAYINELANMNKQCAQALRQKYAQGGYKPSTTFNINVRLGKMWIMGRLHQG